MSSHSRVPSSLPGSSACARGAASPWPGRRSEVGVVAGDLRAARRRRPSPGRWSSTSSTRSPRDPALARGPARALRDGRHDGQGRVLPAQVHDRRAQRDAHERAQQLHRRQPPGDHELLRGPARGAGRGHRRAREVRRGPRLPADHRRRPGVGGGVRPAAARDLRHHVHGVAGQVEPPAGVLQPGRQGPAALPGLLQVGHDVAGGAAPDRRCRHRHARCDPGLDTSYATNTEMAKTHKTPTSVWGTLDKVPAIGETRVAGPTALEGRGPARRTRSWRSSPDRAGWDRAGARTPRARPRDDGLGRAGTWCSWRAAGPQATPRCLSTSCRIAWTSSATSLDSGRVVILEDPLGLCLGRRVRVHGSVGLPALAAAAVHQLRLAELARRACAWPGGPGSGRTTRPRGCPPPPRFSSLTGTPPTACLTMVAISLSSTYCA